MQIRSSSFRRLAGQLSLLILLFQLASCRFSMVAAPDNELKESVVELSRKVDKFYLGLLENIADDSLQLLSYDYHRNTYMDIEVELNYILLRSKMKPLNVHSVKIAEIALKLWTKYKDEHRQDWKKYVMNGKTGKPLEKGDLIIKKLDIHRVFEAMLIAETAKELTKKEL